jgi:D-galactarolactone cycloisomerase
MTDLARRTFIGAGAAALLASPLAATIRLARKRRDGLYAFPEDGPPLIDFTRWIDKPVKLRSAEIYKLNAVDQFVRVVSEDGVEGVCMGNSRLEEVVSLFKLAVLPGFIGQDVRDLQAIIQRTYRAQVKFAGLPFWTALGHLELAIWDMLGKTAQQRCVTFMGPVVRTEIPLYASSLDRKTSPEEEVANMQKAVAALGVDAIKIKVGNRLSYNEDAAPMRSEKLVALARKTFGDAMTIYADANGSYDAPRAIELCRMLEDNGVAILEEPCPHEDPEMTKQVTDRVRKIKIAGGEQDGRMEQWRWYLEHRGLDLLQPDFMYNGGMVRTLMVQKMAAAAGIGVAPHFPQSGASSAQLIHFAAYAPNLHGYQEYRARPHKHDFAHSPRIAPRNGKLSLPEGPGWGVEFDPALWKLAERIA